MADNNLFVGKWIPSDAVDIPAEEIRQHMAQFYKDGSCKIPAAMLGKEDSGAAMFYFYQVYENGMMKLDSGEPVQSLYHCAMVGDTMTLTAIDGASFSFVKAREEREKRPFFKQRAAAEAAPAVAKKEREPEPEREPTEYEWKCPSCGKINQNYVGTCGCGAAKPNDKLFNWAEVHPDLVKKPEEEPAPVIEEPKEEEKPKKPEIPEREPEEYEWKCPQCGKINQNYVGTCGCGAAKPNDKLFNWAEVHPDLVKKPEIEEPAPVVEEPKEEKKAKKEEPAPERQPLEYEWKCPKCGKINQNYVGTCGCGEKKPNDKLFNWAEVHPDLVKKPEEEPAPVVEEPKEDKKAKKEKDVPAAPEKVAGENEWKCPSCGKINQNYVGTCGCGERKPFHPAGQK